MRNEPSVSVIVPMYNQRRGLRRLVDNLRSQTLPDAQFVIVDDGSTDGSFDKARELVSGDPRFEVFSQENAGTGAARNAGIRYARGRYLFFLDADDRIAFPDVLARLCAVADREGVSVSGGSIRFEKRGCPLARGAEWSPDAYCDLDGFASRTLSEEPFEYFSEGGVFSYSQYQYDAGFTRFLYSRDLIVGNGICFPERRYFEDPAFFIAAMDAAGAFAAVPDDVYVYTVGWHGGCHDERYFLETLRGIEENLVFSKKRGYPRLHAITAVRAKYCHDIDLVLSDGNIERLRSAAHAMWDAFDPAFAECGDAVPVPACLGMVDSYGSPEWDAPEARRQRARRRVRARLVGAVKGSRLMDLARSHAEGGC